MLSSSQRRAHYYTMQYWVKSVRYLIDTTGIYGSNDCMLHVWPDRMHMDSQYSFCGTGCWPFCTISLTRSPKKSTLKVLERVCCHLNSPTLTAWSIFPVVIQLSNIAAWYLQALAFLYEWKPLRLTSNGYGRIFFFTLSQQVIKIFFNQQIYHFHNITDKWSVEMFFSN